VFGAGADGDVGACNKAKRKRYHQKQLNRCKGNATTHKKKGCGTRNRIPCTKRRTGSIGERMKVQEERGRTCLAPLEDRGMPQKKEGASKASKKRRKDVLQGHKKRWGIGRGSTLKNKQVDAGEKRQRGHLERNRISPLSSK